MTDRVSHLIVALDKDVRVDDVEVLVSAIRMMRNVGDVQLGLSEPGEFVQRMRAREEVREKIWELYKSLSQ